MVVLRKVFWALFIQLVVGWSVTSAQNGRILTLEEARRSYLSKNPEVEAERQRMEMARGELRQAGLFPNPQLNYSQEGFPLGDENLSFFTDQEFLIWATQKLELGGKRRRRTEVSRFMLEAAEAELNDWIRKKTAQLKETFYRVYFNQSRRELALRHLETYYRIREIHRRRYEEGEVSGLSQLRIDLEEVRFLSAVDQAETDFASAWTELAALIVWPDREAPTLEMTVPSFPEASLEELKETAYRLRQDLKAVALRIEEMSARVGLEESQRIPDLTVGGGYKRDFGINSFYAAVQLPIPLFDRNQGAVYRARAELRRVENQQLWKRTQVGAEVERAYAIYRSRQSNADRLQRDLLERAERMWQATRLSYQEGEASVADYLDALRVRLDASLSFYDLLLQLHRARLELEKATGAELP